jgi:hypothetical protein
MRMVTRCLYSTIEPAATWLVSGIPRVMPGLSFVLSGNKQLHLLIAANRSNSNSNSVRSITTRTRSVVGTCAGSRVAKSVMDEYSAISPYVTVKRTSNSTWDKLVESDYSMIERANACSPLGAIIQLDQTQTVSSISARTSSAIYGFCIFVF